MISDGFDNPGIDPAADAFQRFPFSKRIADTIVTFDTRDGAPVIGIFGKWGYGKNTVLNYIKNELKTHPEQIEIFEFNPWFFTSQESLLTGFFLGLAECLERSLDKPGKSMGTLLMNYSGMLSAIPYVGSAAVAIAERFGQVLSADSLKEQRTRLVEMMRDAKRTVVVLIDDLDRLDQDEIMTMLKVVRLTANFPHVIYLLAFDDEMVSKAAGAKYGGGSEAGRQFLEKIVQYPFSLPAVGLNRLRDYVVQHARDSCADANIALEAAEWKMFEELTETCLIKRLTTPRQAIRYANALRFALPMLAGDIHPLTQMLVEAMRVLFPEIYALVRDNMRLFTVDEKITANNERSIDPMRARIKSAMLDAAPDQVEAAIGLIEALFYAAPLASGVSVRNVRYFDRYFLYAVPSDDISRPELEEILSVSAVNVDSYDNVLHIKTSTKAQRLIALVKIIVLKAGKRAVIDFVSKRGLLPGDKVEVFDDPLCIRAAHVLAELIYRSEVEAIDRAQMGRDLVQTLEPLPFAVLYFKVLEHLVLEGYKAAQLDKNRSETFIEEAKAQQDILINRIREAANYETFYSSLTRLDAFEVLKKWHDCKRVEQQAWLEARLKTHPDESRDFLEIFRYLPNQYAEIVRLVTPKVLIKALGSTWGRALKNGTKNGEYDRQLGDAMQFITDFIYHRSQARLRAIVDAWPDKKNKPAAVS